MIDSENHISAKNERLRDHLILVTGATGGIGQAICHRLISESATVIVSDVDAQRCEQVAAELNRLGGTAYARELDVGFEGDWAHAAKFMHDLGAPILGLVNNAGVGEFTTVESETMESWERVLRVNQYGVWLGMQAIGPMMVKSGGGSIVNISSIWGTLGGFGTHFSYHSAKGAVRSMSKSAAVHWGPSRVRVNTVHPGFIGTEASKALWENHPRREKMLERTPMGRFGETAEVAAGVAFLLSPDSTFVTGSELYIDGGLAGR